MTLQQQSMHDEKSLPCACCRNREHDSLRLDGSEIINIPVSSTGPDLSGGEPTGPLTEIQACRKLDWLAPQVTLWSQVILAHTSGSELRGPIWWGLHQYDSLFSNSVLVQTYINSCVLSGLHFTPCFRSTAPAAGLVTASLRRPLLSCPASPHSSRD